MSKTQISHLKSGIKNQRILVLNGGEYSSNLYPQGHSGSNHSDVQDTWAKIGEENPEFLIIRVKGLELKLQAHWSLSRKSLSYSCNISKDDLKLFGVVPAEYRTPYIQIQGNEIKISNGKNAYCHICPSFIEII